MTRVIPAKAGIHGDGRSPVAEAPALGVPQRCFAGCPSAGGRI